MQKGQQQTHYGNSIHDVGEYVSSLANRFGLGIDKNFNDAIINQIEQRCDFISREELCYSLRRREDTEKALKLLNIKFSDTVVVAGFARNKSFLDSDSSEYSNEPPVVFNCSATQLPDLLCDVGRKFDSGTAWLVSDNTFSILFYIHTDGIVGKTTAVNKDPSS